MAIYVQPTGEPLLDPFIILWNNFIGFLPGLIVAIVILIVGYFVGVALGYVVKRIVNILKVDEHLKKANLKKSIGHLDVSHLSGGIVKWYIFVIFLGIASDFLNITAVSELFRNLSEWFPSLIVAVILMLFGFVFADFAEDRILHAKKKGVRLFGSLAKALIIIFIALIALEQINVKVAFATNTALIIIGAIALAVALVIGIGFGLAFKDEAKGLIAKVKKGL